MVFIYLLFYQISLWVNYLTSSTISVRISYATQTVFIKFIGTHKQYDKIDAETI
jgi:mRNA-degrading endonuclease HigB of HigAB toxin-antitoxin module